MIAYVQNLFVFYMSCCLNAIFTPQSTCGCRFDGRGWFDAKGFDCKNVLMRSSIPSEMFHVNSYPVQIAHIKTYLVKPISG